MNWYFKVDFVSCQSFRMHQKISTDCWHILKKGHICSAMLSTKVILICTASAIQEDGMNYSSRNPIDSEFESLKAQLHDLKSFVDKKSFKRNTKRLFKEELSDRFKIIFEDIELLQSNLKTRRAFEECFNCLAPPNEEVIDEEHIMEI